MVQQNANDFRRADAVIVEERLTEPFPHESRRRASRTSWGAIFAGVMTFLAITVVLSLVTVGIGLSGSGIGAGIWSIIALAIALAAGGFVAGALAPRRGALHGFLTWATSLIVTLGLTVWLSASLLGAVGNMASSVAQAMSGNDLGQVVEEVQGNVSDEDMDQAQDEASQAADDAADTAQASAWWAFAGLLIGGAIATGAGMLGSSAAIARFKRDSEQREVIY